MNMDDAASEAQPGRFPLRIAPVTTSLLEAILDFGAIHYPPGNPNLDRAYLRWLCLDNPAGTAQAVMIGSDRAMVGLALLVPIALSVDGREQLGYFVVNVLTHPEYRNRRLFSQIIDATKAFCRERREWLLGHPNKAAIAGWTRKQMTFRPPLLGMLGGLGFGIGRRIRCLESADELREEWPRVLDSLIPASGETEIVRSVEFMRWRFMDRPGGRYRIAVERRPDGRVGGFSVTRPFKPGLRLLVDYGTCNGGGRNMSIDRPSIAMIPVDRAACIGSVMNLHRLPIRKEMPFFATVFDSQDCDFSRVTLAASDF